MGKRLRIEYGKSTGDDSWCFFCAQGEEESAGMAGLVFQAKIVIVQDGLVSRKEMLGPWERTGLIC